MDNITKIQLNQEDKKLLEGLNIKALVLFGSQAQNNASAGSDYDIGILIDHVSQPVRKKIYDTIYDLISEKINRLVDIDIVFMYDMPLELQFHAVKYGQVLYEENLQVFVNYRESVMIKYADFAPLRQMFQAATMARIP